MKHEKGPMKRWAAIPEGALPAGRVREVVERIRRRSDAFGRIVGREGAVRRIGTGPGVLLRRRMLECLRFN